MQVILMLKLGEIFLVLIEDAVVDREVRLDLNNRVNHWRSVVVAPYCSASRERMLIIHLNLRLCMTKVG